MPRIIAVANRKGGVGKPLPRLTLRPLWLRPAKSFGHRPRSAVERLDSLGIDKHGEMVSSYEVIIGERKLKEAVILTEIPDFRWCPPLPTWPARKWN